MANSSELMSLTTPLPSVLEPMEWTLLRLWNAGKMPGGRVRGVVVRSLPDTHVPCALAVANDYLPNESPYKLTRADVAALESLLANASTTDLEDAIDPDVLPTLTQLRHKLAALVAA